MQILGEICIPEKHLDTTINEYRQVLSHTGYVMIYGTISYLMYHPKLKERCQARILPRDSCQRTKVPGRGYGHLPPRDANNMPWQEITIDLVDPWALKRLESL